MAKILLVDDEEMERVLGKAILEKEGHELFFAADGEAALAVCRETKIELIITDLAMPDFNGSSRLCERRAIAFPSSPYPDGQQTNWTLRRITELTSP